MQQFAQKSSAAKLRSWLICNVYEIWIVSRDFYHRKVYIIANRVFLKPILKNCRPHFVDRKTFQWREDISSTYLPSSPSWSTVRRARPGPSSPDSFPRVISLHLVSLSLLLSVYLAFGLLEARLAAYNSGSLSSGLQRPSHSALGCLLHFPGSHPATDTQSRTVNFDRRAFALTARGTFLSGDRGFEGICFSRQNDVVWRVKFGFNAYEGDLSDNVGILQR